MQAVTDILCFDLIDFDITKNACAFNYQRNDWYSRTSGVIAEFDMYIMFHC